MSLSITFYLEEVQINFEESWMLGRVTRKLENSERIALMTTEMKFNWGVYGKIKFELVNFY